jgi:PAS domain S-box-containing protein
MRQDVRRCRARAISLIRWTTLLLAASIAPAQDPATKHVLILYWEDRDHPANVDFEREFKKALRSISSGPIEYYSEYLESNRFPGESQSLALRDYMQRKYAGREIDVIVTNASAPLDFLLKNRAELFPRTPIVFNATTRPSAAQLSSGAGATGIVYVSGYRKTLELALELHPGTEHIFIVSGNPARDKSWETMARNDLESFSSPATITYLTDLSMQELLTRLRTLPDRSVVLYVWQRLLNGQGVLLEAQDLLRLIAPVTPAPIYGMSFANIGLGIVGGQVWTMEGNSARAAEITLNVLNGARAGDLPVENAPDIPIFDWRQLQRWRIDEERLPPNSIIRFRELTMWQQYKLRIVGAAAVFVLQALLIGALLFQRYQSRRAAAALVQAQRVLQESEERFHNMADTAPVMIWVSGPDKLCTFLNKGWLTFTGREIRQHLGNGWQEAIHPEDVDQCWAGYCSAFDARTPFQKECRIRRADGEYRSCLSTGVPRFQQDGVFAGYIGTFIDITELKRSQERVLAGQKLESLGLMASGIAHDFNNLLGGILAWTELALAENSAGAPHEEELLRIKAGAIGGAEIVRELMIYGGKHSPESEAVDCSLLIREMLQLLKVSISKYAVLRTDLEDNLLMVQGSRAQLRQLVMNLVINASEAIGDRDGEIRIRTRAIAVNGHNRGEFAPNLGDGSFLQIEVADTGRGMTESAKIKIFDPFYTTKPAGRGLGLAVVQGVVHAHGGAIHVESAPGSGTAFQVWLPCVAAAAARSGSAKAGQIARKSGFETGTVLIIEDEDTLRMAVSKMLRNRGFTVFEAADGNTGVDQFVAKASEIDVVLLDMSLPGKSGPEILKDLRRIRPSVKVIFTSAYGKEHVQNSLNGLRPDGYLQKPYQIAGVVTLLQESTRDGLTASTQPAS